MYYDPEKNDHGLRWTPFKSCVVPRPIGWISTINSDGVPNLAPYSQFQNLGFDPPYVMISINQGFDRMRKDTLVNIEETGEFVYNMATYDLREAVNKTSALFPPNVDEFEMAGLDKAPSIRVKPYRVAQSPIQLECKYTQTIRIPGYGSSMINLVIGKVVMIHIKDEFITPEGKIDIAKIQPIAGMGYYDYAKIDSVFEMKPPNEEIKDGLEGKRVIT